jgi:nucleoside-diphosphate-sugar epimerase
VFHLCSHGVGRPDLEQVLPTLHHDLATTVHVLLAATETGAQRVILASSFEEPLPSDATVAPSSPYAAAKWASSMYARMFHLLYRTPVVMLRTFMTYGPRQAEHKLLPHVILSLLRGEAARVSSGAREVDWIYVDDVVAGMLAAAETPRLEGETFDLGSGRLVPIKAVLTKITALVGAAVQPLFGALPDRPCERVRAADLGPVSSRLNWRPVTSLDDGLKKTVDWFRERARAA